jgi:peptidoglycan-associated lipoprotein
MNSLPRSHGLGPALIALLIVVTAASACSRKRPPATTTRTDTGADTMAMRPPPDTRPEDTMGDRMDAVRGTVEEMIFFDFNRSEIKPEYREVLARKADAMSQVPEIAIRIEGHADERGTVEYNLALGERRAQAAKDYLVNAGIDPARVATISYGEERPLVDESNESAWSQNRRDEFVITSSAGGGI